MTIRKKDLVAIATALHDAHLAIEAISTDPRFDYEDRIRRRKRAFLSASKDIANVLRPHNKGFNENKFLAIAIPTEEQLGYGRDQG